MFSHWRPPDGGAEAWVGRHGAMKPGGSGREYSDMGRWDRRRLRGGQQNRGSGGPRNSLNDPSLSTLPCRARIANSPPNQVRRSPARWPMMGGFAGSFAASGALRTFSGSRLRSSPFSSMRSNAHMKTLPSWRRYLIRLNPRCRRPRTRLSGTPKASTASSSRRNLVTRTSERRLDMFLRIFPK